MKEHINKPLPTFDLNNSISQGYWQASKEQKLSLQYCDDCQHWQHFPKQHCEHCKNPKLSYKAVSGQGKVATFSIVEKSFVPGFQGTEPYAIAWIELSEQEGLMVFGNILNTDLNSIHIDMPVEVIFENREGFGTIPNFTKTTHRG